MGGIFIKGKVIRKIKGFYYVLDENCNQLKDENIYECKLRGSLKVKNDKFNCIIGDNVVFDEDEKVITSIEKRENLLERPLISNIDYIGVLMSVCKPEFDITLFQKMLLNSTEQNIPVILILSKIDLISFDELQNLLLTLENCFQNYFPIFPISTEKNIGIENLLQYISNKSIIISGPSGTGKSTLINKLIGENVLTTNEVNSKTSRGRHTTTESRFFKIKENSFIVDTPGFSSLDFPKLENKKELENFFPEFTEYVGQCKFRDCIHVNEPNCAIKNNVDNGNIQKIRYDFYINALNNIFKK